MKMKNIEIVSQINAMDCILERSLPVKIAYAIKKNYKKLAKEYEDYFETLSQINGELKDKEGNVLAGKELEYEGKLKELLNIEVEIDFFMIKGEIFESNNFNMTLQELNALDFMIE